MVAMHHVLHVPVEQPVNHAVVAIALFLVVNYAKQQPNLIVLLAVKQNLVVCHAMLVLGSMEPLVHYAMHHVPLAQMELLA